MRIEDYNLKNDIVVMMKIMGRLKFAFDPALFSFEAISSKAAVDSALKAKFISIISGNNSGNNIVDPRSKLSETQIIAGERKFALAEFYWEYTDPDTRQVIPIKREMPDRCTPLLDGNAILSKLNELGPSVRAANVAETLSALQANPDWVKKYGSFAIYGEKGHGFAINSGHFSYLAMDCKLGLRWTVPVIVS